MIIDKQTIRNNFISAIQFKTRDERIQERDDLIKRMGYGRKNPPLMITTSYESVINPWFVALFHSQKGVPKELLFELLNDSFGVEVEKYWGEWCEFWFKSFTTIPHNWLCDSRMYFEKMGHTSHITHPTARKVRLHSPQMDSASR